MKRFLSFLLILLSCSVFAQNNIGTTYCNHNDLNSSRYQPSELDLGSKHVQIGFNYNLWMGNSAFDYKTANSIYNSGTITDSNINTMIGKLDKKNIFGVGQDFQVIGLAFQYKTKSEKKYDISVSIVDKFAANLIYSDNFMKLALKGNKQFAGQTVDLGPLMANAQYRREYVVGTAFPLFGNQEFGMRVGVRGKFMQGMGALYMPKGDATMTTDAQGRYIDLNFDYNVNTSGLKGFSPFKYNGKGYGVDLGATMYLSKYLEVVASVLNIGSIYYNKNTTNYQKTGSVHYDGMAVEGFFGGGSSGDSLQKVFTPNTTTGGTFRMPLDTKISLEVEFKTSRKDKKDREYVDNALFLTYIQGLNNMPGATTRPFVSVGYNHDFHKFFDAGACLSMGGYNKFTGGAFFSLNIAHVVKFGLSSDNLAAFIVPKYGTGIDLSTNFSVSF
ncbi:MAG: DUF5723 family protein [Cytophagaceae bacterium]